MAITAKMQEYGNGRKFTKSFRKGTRSQQVAFQKAVLAATVASLTEVLESSPIVPADAGTTAASGLYSDAILRFRKGAETDSYPFEQLTNAVSNGAGFVDVTDPLMVAIEAAFVGKDGATGWTLYEGEYVR